MPPLPHGVRYAIISPVKDEEVYVEATLRSVANQTWKPSQWVIVDDGSTDRTPEILSSYAKQFPWIQVVRVQRGPERQLGSAEIRAFSKGLEHVQVESLDFVVKLDCDVDLPPDYFERLLAKFQEDENLGIASGVYLENHTGNWTAIPMPAYHAAGASKVVRTACFREISGFALYPGWDTADEIKAQALGWRTCHFEEIQFRHLKPEGAGIGSLQKNLLHGEAYYRTGGGKLFFLMKVLHRLLFGRPFFIAGLALLWGFLSTWASGKKRLVSDVEARFYQRQLNARIRMGSRPPERHRIHEVKSAAMPLLHGIRYAVISPVKDEARYIEKTLRAMIKQTIRPSRWVIVDDGSQDETPQILQRYAQDYSWIHVVTLPRKTERQPGAPVIRAFQAGRACWGKEDFDFVVKLDGDLEFEADYFEQLLGRFQKDPRLGIASGVYVEETYRGWLPVPMPAYHAAGACKVMRARCFEEIGGFVPERGWDTVDEIRAQMRGWKTRHFEEIQFYHLKSEGSGIGSLPTNLMLGEVYYLSGGGFLFFAFKVVNRMLTHQPYLRAGLAMFRGYLKARRSGMPKLVSPEEAHFYREALNRRIVNRLRTLIGLHPWPETN